MQRQMQVARTRLVVFGVVLSGLMFLTNASVAGAAASSETSPPLACSFNGIAAQSDGSTIIGNISPGGSIAMTCQAEFGFTVVESSPLVSEQGVDNETDFQSQPFGVVGVLNGVFHVPAPFVAADPAASCPPTPQQVAEGLQYCELTVYGNESRCGCSAVASVRLAYSAPPAPSWTGIASSPAGRGYWIVRSDGVVHAHGDVSTHGDLSGTALNEPIRGIASTPDGKGYWLVASDGGVFAFGDAHFYGSMADRSLVRPVVDLVPTPDGRGYWLVAEDGGVFAFGDARFHGSMGDGPAPYPIVGMALDSATGGYWLEDGWGNLYPIDAPPHGSLGGPSIYAPTREIVPTPDGGGYWTVGVDGGVFSYGDARFHGSMAGPLFNGTIVGMAPDEITGGYWLVGVDGGVFAFDAPFFGAG